MKYRVVFSASAEEDLESLGQYLLNRFYLEKVQSFLERLVKTCLSLDTFPYRGKEHEGLSPGLRSLSFERRVTILFTVQSDDVVIVGLYYRGRTP